MNQAVSICGKLGEGAARGVEDGIEHGGLGRVGAAEDEDEALGHAYYDGGAGDPRHDPRRSWMATSLILIPFELEDRRRGFPPPGP